jgi:Arc/MetJ family transcription regulator
MDTIYEQFISYLKEKEKNISGYVEKHRIIPGHSGGKYIDNNIVLVSFPEHCLAHFYRYLAYGNSIDLYAYHKMVGDTVEARISRSKSGGEAAKNIKVGCFKDYKCREDTLINPGRSAYYNKDIQSSNGKKRKKQLIEEGFFSSEKQIVRGKRGVEVNRKNGTGAFDPKNLEKARKKQKEMGTGVHNKLFQKSMAFRRWGVVLDGKRLFYDLDMRTTLSETFVDYHLNYGLSNKYSN